MGEFNLDDHYSYYCGQEFLRRNGVVFIVNKRVWNAILGCNLKNDRMISVWDHSRQTIQYHSNPSLCPDQQCWRGWNWTILWDLQDLLGLTAKKRCPFHYRGWNKKEGSQEIPGVTGKFDFGLQNEVGRRLTEFCQENTLAVANTLFQQHKRTLYIWTSPHGQHWNQIDYILCRQRWKNSIQSAKTWLGADCGSDHKLLIEKFRLKL